MADKVRVCVRRDDLELVMTLARRVLHEHAGFDYDLDEAPEGLDGEATMLDYEAALGSVQKAIEAAEAA